TQTIGGVGSQRQTESANGTHSGDITVVAGGDITFRSGFGTGSTAFSQIGHGGYRNLADIYDDPSNPRVNPDGTTGVVGGGASALDQQGHNGDIVVTAGGAISFIAGQVEGEILPGQEPFGIENNRNLNFTMIGNGGDESFGDHWGNVTITAGGDLTMEGRGGWDAVTIEGTNAGPADPTTVNANQRGTPRLGSTEDNGGTGTRNFAMIGNGGFNASHRLHSTQTNNSSGKVGEGIGTFGPSDITITTGGDVVLKAARTETVGPKLLTPAIRQALSGGVYTYLDGFGNPVDLSAEIGQHSARLEVVDRADGDRWIMPEPVMAAQDSFVQVGNGGRSTNYQGGVLIGGAADGIGHQGDITINAGGGVTLDSGNFKASVGLRQTVTVQTSTGSFEVGPGAPDADLIGTIGGTSGTDTRGQRNRSIHARNYSQIGNGGWNARGDHSGNITILAGTNGDGVGLRVQAGESREDYSQVGNGGFDSDGYDPLGGINTDNNRLNDTGATGTISIDVTGDVIVQGGGTDFDATGESGLTTNASDLATHDDDRYSYAQIGHGGAATGGSHVGDITVFSRNGSLDVKGGNNARYGYAMLGNGGLGSRGQSHSGTILAVAANDVTVAGGVPYFDIEDPFGAPANAGNISTTHISFAQIGHGGWDSDPQGGNLNLTQGVGGHTGDIEVVSIDGSVILRGGGDPGLTRNDDTYFRGLSAHIGNGGNFTDGDHSGNIRVSAGTNVEIYGGAGGRDSFTMIGHGGLQVDGNLDGTIEVIAGEDLILNRGADTDTSSFDRAGQEIFNNFAKIGHGDQRYRQRNSGAGARNGDIFVSVGDDIILADPANRPFADAAHSRLLSDLVLIGHVDPINGGSSAFRSLEGNTYLAASRTDPYDGTGSAQIHPDAVITSSGGGFFGELRLYLPSPAQNQILDEATFNSSAYTRTPTPDGTRADELVGADHTQMPGIYGEPDGTFVPEGAYSPSGYGLYNIYYAGDAPVVPPVVVPPTSDGGVLAGAVEEPILPEEEIIVDILPDLLQPFLFSDKYDSYDRYLDRIDDPLLGGLLTSLGEFADTVFGFQQTEEDIPVEGDEVLEESPGMFGLGPAQTEEERREEEENAAQYRNLSRANYGQFWTYDLSRQGYSSYTVFGVPYSVLNP
ncbi:MAG: hypothetical protein KDL87_02950, partial [Verrucomicrobiae bacterium]|nr:hypothetical protein [Verrucomicrobiae bacterium]